MSEYKHSHCRLRFSSPAFAELNLSLPALRGGNGMNRKFDLRKLLKRKKQKQICSWKSLAYSVPEPFVFGSVCGAC